MKKKQVFSLALIMLAVFVLCGCGSKQEMSLSGAGESLTVNDLALRPAASHVLRYEDCRCVTLTLNENGVETEELQYENGTGSFTLLSTNELRWQDDTGHAADDALFIAVG